MTVLKTITPHLLEKKGSIASAPAWATYNLSPLLEAINQRSLPKGSITDPVLLVSHPFTAKNKQTGFIMVKISEIKADVEKTLIHLNVLFFKEEKGTKQNGNSYEATPNLSQITFSLPHDVSKPLELKHFLHGQDSFKELGLGNSLFNICTRIARDLKRSITLESAPSAIPFYEKEGLTQVNQKENPTFFWYG